MHWLSDLERRPCPCCGLVPAWFGCRTWCLCEPAPEATVLCGVLHECTAPRRLHRHSFRRMVAEEDMSGVLLGVVFVCGCGQERRLEPAA